MDVAKLKYFVGVDIQVRRGIAYATLDRDARLFNAGWVSGSDDGISDFIEMVEGLTFGDPEVIAIGVDAPRQPLIQPRNWYWNGRNRRWRERRPSERGAGRHCEVIIKAHGIANPQWTGQQAERQFNLTADHLDLNPNQEHCHACTQPAPKAFR